MEIPRHRGDSGTRIPIPLSSLLGCLCLLTVTACASSGASSDTPRASSGTIAIAGATGPNTVVETYTPVAPDERVVAAREDEIWPHLEPIFGQLGIEVTEVKEAQWIMGNPRVSPRRIDGERLSTYLECGGDHGGPYADQHKVWLTFMVQLLRNADGGTRVAMLLNGSAQPRNVTATALPCQSTRVLEGRLISLIEERLAN